MGAIALQLMKSNKRFLIGRWGLDCRGWAGTWFGALLLPPVGCRAQAVELGSPPRLCSTWHQNRTMPDQLPPSTSPSPLAGQAMDEKVEREIVQHLQDDDMVVRVIDPKSEEMGDGVYR